MSNVLSNVLILLLLLVVRVIVYYYDILFNLTIIIGKHQPQIHFNTVCLERNICVSLVMNAASICNSSSFSLFFQKSHCVKVMFR